MEKKRPDSLLPYGGSSDQTRELTGTDAHMDEAAIGDAGNGADPYGADLTGGFPTPIEDPPDSPSDIVPDQIEDWPGLAAEKAAAEEAPEPTARPHEPLPIEHSELP
ncbi:hypothetical protein [Vulgatibacter incomptus]|uniref:Uncharacterized protein n=1 Tax=Vulgatibacter incomptus TaxID=1391653 RepID=A0A0K1PFT4_9BACT|nr:hypothetical protein [Vulgatibacter incomptus]AKU92367.1 hypothetical protein AKJ08_2754 [Vulgatibacter incomptus]